jgi:hypothetical protein
VTAKQALGPLEIASGYIFGHEEDVPPLPTVDRAASPRRELEAAIRGALASPPCLVAFSGGRDSSAVLALAATVARREGLPLPIPFTHRFPEAAAAEESEWQELVVAHLTLDDWVKRDVTDELDGVGPIATRSLLRHGLYVPANAFFLVSALEAASGGTLLTGVGGDQLLDPGRHARAATVVARKTWPQPRDALRFGLAAAPLFVRAAVLRRRDQLRVVCPWLRAPAFGAVLDAAAREAATEPIRRRAWVDWTWRARAVQQVLRIMALLAADAGTKLVHPFFAPRVMASFGNHPSFDRTAAMRALVGDLLPTEVCERRSKAVFSLPFWNRHARAFAATLTPAELDSELVDGERTVELWTRKAESPPPFRSLTLLQSTWLARHGGASGQPAEKSVSSGIEALPVHGPPQLEAG